MKGIADTGFIVAFANRNDQYHSWASSLARHLTEPLLTCDAVIAEAIFHLSSAVAVLALVQDSLLELSFSLADNFPQIQQLAGRYRDQNPDLADLCLVRMSEIYPKHMVITVDRDFRIYRRYKRDAIPLLFPPGV